MRQRPWFEDQALLHQTLSSKGEHLGTKPHAWRFANDDYFPSFPSFVLRRSPRSRGQDQRIHKTFANDGNNTFELKAVTTRAKEVKPQSPHEAIEASGPETSGGTFGGHTTKDLQNIVRTSFTIEVLLTGPAVNSSRRAHQIRRL